MAESREEGECPHHQILRVHRQYAFRQHLRLQEAVPYLKKRKAIPRDLSRQITERPEDNDGNINFLLAYLREAKVERFVRFIEALGDSTFAQDKPIIKSHVTLLDTMSEQLVKISNASLEQIRRVRAVVKSLPEGKEGISTVEAIPSGEVDTEEATDTRTDISSHEIAWSKLAIVDTTEKSKSETELEPTYHTQNTQEKTVRVDSCPSETETSSKKALTEGSNTQATPKMHSGHIEPRIAKWFQRESLREKQSSWLLEDSAHGISIAIPIDAVPPEIMKFVVIVHAYLNGHFKFPEDHEVCSAIFTLKTQPDFDFLAPVSLKFPHSAIFDEDDDEDLVVLRAEDPMNNETHNSVYTFNDTIITEFCDDYDYYIEVKLDHFSAVAGAKRRRRIKHQRRSSILRGRQMLKSTRRGSRIKRSLKKGDSSGSSRQSSYDASFEKDLQQSFNLPRQSSSAESDRTPQRSTLQRQEAIEAATSQYDSPIPLLHQASSECDMALCNAVHIACCSPLWCVTNWTSRFLLVPNHPTGKKVYNFTFLIEDL